MEKNKTGKYLKYAIGEIVLVVIGILIALSLNNWKESLDKKDQLQSIFKVIKQDLETDSLLLTSQIFKYYEEKDTLYLKIINNKYQQTYIDSLNSSNYENCDICKSIIHSFLPFYPQERGYELLKNFNPISNIKSDSLFVKIMQFYNRRVKNISASLQVIEKQTTENLNWLEKYPWYSDNIWRIFNREAVAFFHQNQEYKNKVTTIRIFMTLNLLKKLHEYNNEAVELINDIEIRLTEK